MPARKLKHYWAPKICSFVPLNVWHRFLGIDLLIPYYHVVSDDKLAHISGLYKFRSIKQFKSDLEFFLSYYTPISLQDLINHLDGRDPLPKRCFLLTFDDGFREIYDIVTPILTSYGVPALFFLTTSVLDNCELCYPQKKSLLLNALPLSNDSHAKKKALQIFEEIGVKGADLLSCIDSINYDQRNVVNRLEPLLGCDFASYVAMEQPYMTSEQVEKLLNKGFAIGAHSIDHPLYSDLSLEKQLIQTKESMSFLSTHFNYECNAFAFPYKDIGVSNEFFQKAFSDGSLKVSFGTGGVTRHFFPRNLERFSMERTNFPAELILARQFARTLLRKQ